MKALKRVPPVEGKRSLSKDSAGRVEISVCMATYNGSLYIERQVESILAQLSATDELVVVDDGSTDATVELLRGFADPRIKLTRSPENAGHVKTFAAALTRAQGDIIFMSDQDDVWIQGRLDLMRQLLGEAPVCATSYLQDSLGRVDSPKRMFARTERRGVGRVFWDLTLGRGPYYGCAMGMRREVLDLVLPMPRFVEAHDHWIALAGGVAGGVAVTDAASVVRTVHGSNLTPLKRRGFAQLASTRLRLLLSVAALLYRRRVLP